VRLAIGMAGEDTQEYVKEVFEASQKVIKDGSGLMGLLFGARTQRSATEESSGRPAYGSNENRDGTDSTGRARLHRGQKN